MRIAIVMMRVRLIVLMMVIMVQLVRGIDEMEKR